MTHESYQAVAALDEEATRALLACGDPPERVWAAWVIAMRHGGERRPDLRAAAEGEPSAGVRRHLCIVLTGLGDREVVRAMADADPDEHVRTTAGCILARCAGPEDVADHDVLQRRLEVDPSIDTRIAIAGSLRTDAPVRVRAAVEALLDHEDIEARTTAAEAILGWHGGEPMPASLRARARTEPRASLRQRLLSEWIDRDSLAAVVRDISDPLDAVAIEILSLVHTPVPFAAIAPWSTRDVEELSRLLAQHAAPEEEAWRAWLLDRVEGSRSGWQDAWASLAHAIAVVGDLLADPERARLRSLAGTWRSRADELAATLRARGGVAAARRDDDGLYIDDDGEWMEWEIAVLRERAGLIDRHV